MAKNDLQFMFKIGFLGLGGWLLYQTIEAGGFTGIGKGWRCLVNPSLPECAGGGAPPPGPKPSPIPPPGPKPPPSGCDRSFIPGKRYVDYNPSMGQYAVVMCGQVISWHDRQTEAEAYYNAIVCNPEYQNC